MAVARDSFEDNNQSSSNILREIDSRGLRIELSTHITKLVFLSMEAATEDLDIQDVDQETPAENVFIAPSFHEAKILAGASYTHHSPIPNLIEKDLSVECVLGVDEAGRGPVLGTELSIYLET